MGADFVFSICEMVLTKEQAYTKADELTKADKATETATSLAEQCGVELEDNEINAYLKKCIDEVYAPQGRDTGSFRLDEGKRDFLITGGMTWGDSPTDAYQSFIVCEVFELTTP
jgi:hypothetical protein